MREIETHKVNGVNDGLTITVLDEPGPGGANHVYRVQGTIGAPAVWDIGDIRFQHGPLAEAGINGLTHEVLLAIVADRLRCFQNGPYQCPENADALWHVLSAMDALKARTEARRDRGVEDTMKV